MVRRSRAPSGPSDGWTLPWEFAGDPGVQWLVHPEWEAHPKPFSPCMASKGGQLLAGAGVEAGSRSASPPKCSLVVFSQIDKPHDFQGDRSGNLGITRRYYFCLRKGQKYL